MTKIELKPSETFKRNSSQAQILLLACGALAREIVDLIGVNKWSAFDMQCLPAIWHNTPHLIVPALREKIRDEKNNYRKIFVVYGDCGTGGLLDAMLAEEGVERISGPHCSSFFTGNAAFEAKGDDDMTAFYLTDYLARQFDKLIWEGLGLDRHPDLRDIYFGNYTKVIYLAQVEEAHLQEAAKAAAQMLGLEYEYRFTGYGDLAETLAKQN